MICVYRIRTDKYVVITVRGYDTDERSSRAPAPPPSSPKSTNELKPPVTVTPKLVLQYHGLYTTAVCTHPPSASPRGVPEASCQVSGEATRTTIHAALWRSHAALRLSCTRPTCYALHVLMRASAPNSRARTGRYRPVAYPSAALDGESSTAFGGAWAASTPARATQRGSREQY